MTIPLTARTVQYAGNGSTLAFAVPFKFFAAGDLAVALRDAAGVETPQSLTTNYSVAGGDGATGTITMVVAPASGLWLVISGAMPVQQPDAFGDFIPALTLNRALDRQTIATQELGGRVDRALTVPIGDAGGQLPPLAQGEGAALSRANGAWVFVKLDAVSMAGSVIAAAASAAAALGYQQGAQAAKAAIDASVALLPKRVTKTVATSITSNATLASDPDLTVPLAAGAMLVLRGRLNYSTGATGDFKWSLTGPTATSVHIDRTAIAPGDTAASGVGTDTAYAVSTAITGAAGSGTVEFEAVIVNGNAAGTVAVQWAQNTSDATATVVKPGSYIEWAPVPSTSTFAFPTSYTGAIGKLGEFNSSVNAGHNVRTSVAGIIASYLDTMVTGSKLEAYLFGNGAVTYTVTVDGVPQSVTPPNINDWSWVTIYNGADTTRRVTLRGTYFEADTCIRVSGFTPSLARPSDLPAYYILAQHTSEIAQEGMRTQDTNGGTTNAQRIWLGSAGFGLRFRASGAQIALWTFNGLTPGRILLFRDGGSTPIADVTPGGGLGTYAVTPIATGLTGTHDYELVFVSRIQYNYVAALLVDGLDATPIAQRPLDCYYGDSIVQMPDATSGTITDSRVHDSYITSHAAGHSAVRIGYAGQNISIFLRDATTDIAALPQVPVRIFNEGGVNDAKAGVNLSTFQTDYQAQLTHQRTIAPSARIICEGILDTAYISGATRTAYNTRIAAAVAAMGDANIVYLTTDGWIDPTNGVDTVDGLHLTAVGYGKRAAARALVI